ncbi:MAG: endonuclease/exonuclease/phosphatase family protein [Dehalococcoidia bacterium]|nr:endonuclease/exonuclease/phosphatase family protein [Dehalococcoidia bacterium]
MPAVTIATLNLFNRMGQWGLRAPLLIDQLEELAPDVLGLQEVDLTLDQGMWVSRQINKRRAERPHYRIKHATNPDTRASYHAIATLSCIPFEEHEVLDLMSFERVAQRMVFRCGDRPFVFVNTHLHHPPEAQQERVEQLERLMAWLGRDTRGLPTVIAGDFNAYAEPPEPAVRLMKSRFRSAVETAQGREPEKTWTTPVNTYDDSPHGTLDYIFVSGQWQVLAAGLAFDRPSPLDPNVYPSDHLGLYARLAL